MKRILADRRLSVLLVAIIFILLLAVWVYIKGLQPTRVIPGLNLEDYFAPDLSLVTVIGGSSSSGTSTLNQPLAVDISQAGDIYVLDTGNNQIKVFDQKGKFKFMFGNTSQLYLPSDIKVAGEYVYVADPKNMRIQLFNLQGDLIKTFCSSKQLGASIGAFVPVAIDVNGKEQVFLTDIFYQRILAFDRGGQLLFQAGQPGSGKGQLLYPNGIVCDAHGQVYVSDSNNRRIQVFNDKGKFIGILKQGRQELGINMPRGLAISGKGHLYVAETFGHQLLAYKVDGGKVGSTAKFGNRGADLEQFNFPNDVAINKDVLCIADRANDRVVVYKLKD